MATCYRFVIMASALRFLGLLNAAIWLGSGVFFTAIVGPAFFSREMAQLLSKADAGGAAQILILRYFWLHVACGLIGLAHLTAERLQSKHPWPRTQTIILLVLLSLGLVGATWLQPHMKALHTIMYSPKTPPSEAEATRHRFGAWHGASQAINLIVLGCLVANLTLVTRRTNTADPNG